MYTDGPVHTHTPRGTTAVILSRVMTISCVLGMLYAPYQDSLASPLSFVHMCTRLEIQVFFEHQLENLVWPFWEILGIPLTGYINYHTCRILRKIAHPLLGQISITPNKNRSSYNTKRNLLLGKI